MRDTVSGSLVVCVVVVEHVGDVWISNGFGGRVGARFAASQGVQGWTRAGWPATCQIVEEHVPRLSASGF